MCAACAAVGLSVPSAYNHRVRWAAFGRRWDEALAIGYERIEGALIEAACMMLNPVATGAPPPPPELAISGMTVEAAVQLLWLHQKQVREAGNAPGARRRAVDTDKLYARLERGIARVERRYARGPANAAADQRGLAHGVAAMRGLGERGGWRAMAGSGDEGSGEADRARSIGA